MLKLILRDLIDESIPIYINDIEIKSQRYMPTWDLLQELIKRNPDTKFSFCMGTDLLTSYKTWEQGVRLAEEINFIILSRPSYTADRTLFPKTSQFIETAVEGSSTAIRTRIAKHVDYANKLNLGINGLTASSVIKYIKENCLYQICEGTSSKSNSSKKLIVNSINNL